MIRGRFDLVCYEPEGWVVWRRQFPNLWTTEGMNLLLNSIGGTAIPALYVGLISSVSYTAIAAGDTAAQIVGNSSGSNLWAEACNGTYLPTYSQTVRPTLTLAVAAGGQRLSSAAAAFSITAIGTVLGAFLVTDNTVGGQLGSILSEGLFVDPPGAQAVVAGQTLNVTYTVAL